MNITKKLETAIETIKKYKCEKKIIKEIKEKGYNNLILDNRYLILFEILENSEILNLEENNDNINLFIQDDLQWKTAYATYFYTFKKKTVRNWFLYNLNPNISNITDESVNHYNTNMKNYYYHMIGEKQDITSVADLFEISIRTNFEKINTIFCDLYQNFRNLNSNAVELLQFKIICTLLNDNGKFIAHHRNCNITELNFILSLYSKYFSRIEFLKPKYSNSTDYYIVGLGFKKPADIMEIINYNYKNIKFNNDNISKILILFSNFIMYGANYKYNEIINISIDFGLSQNNLIKHKIIEKTIKNLNNRCVYTTDFLEISKYYPNSVFLFKNKFKDIYNFLFTYFLINYDYVHLPLFKNFIQYLNTNILNGEQYQIYKNYVNRLLIEKTPQVYNAPFTKKMRSTFSSYKSLLILTGINQFKNICNSNVEFCNNTTYLQYPNLTIEDYKFKYNNNYKNPNTSFKNTILLNNYGDYIKYINTPKKRIYDCVFLENDYLGHQLFNEIFYKHIYSIFLNGAIGIQSLNFGGDFIIDLRNIILTPIWEKLISILVYLFESYESTEFKYVNEFVYYRFTFKNLQNKKNITEILNEMIIFGMKYIGFYFYNPDDYIHYIVNNKSKYYNIDDYIESYNYSTIKEYTNFEKQIYNIIDYKFDFELNLNEQQNKNFKNIILLLSNATEMYYNKLVSLILQYNSLTNVYLRSDLVENFYRKRLLEIINDYLIYKIKLNNIATEFIINLKKYDINNLFILQNQNIIKINSKSLSSAINLDSNLENGNLEIILASYLTLNIEKKFYIDEKKLQLINNLKNIEKNEKIQNLLYHNLTKYTKKTDNIDILLLKDIILKTDLFLKDNTRCLQITDNNIEWTKYLKKTYNISTDYTEYNYLNEHTFDVIKYDLILSFVNYNELNTKIKNRIITELDLDKSQIKTLINIVSNCNKGTNCIIDSFGNYYTNPENIFITEILYAYHLYFEEIILYKPKLTDTSSNNFFIIGKNYKYDRQTNNTKSLIKIYQNYKLGIKIFKNKIRNVENLITKFILSINNINLAAVNITRTFLECTTTSNKYYKTNFECDVINENFISSICKNYMKELKL